MTTSAPAGHFVGELLDLPHLVADGAVVRHHTAGRCRRGRSCRRCCRRPRSESRRSRGRATRSPPRRRGCCEARRAISETSAAGDAVTAGLEDGDRAFERPRRHRAHGPARRPPSPGRCRPFRSSPTRRRRRSHPVSAGTRHRSPARRAVLTHFRPVTQTAVSARSARTVPSQRTGE